MSCSRAFYGALLDRRAGTVQPLAYAFGLADAARRAGARLHDYSPVTDMDRENGQWRLTCPGGIVRARKVILAVQGYADYAFHTQQAHFIPFIFFQFATPPLPAEIRETILPGGHGAWDTNISATASTIILIPGDETLADGGINCDAAISTRSSHTESDVETKLESVVAAGVNVTEINSATVQGTGSPTDLWRG